MRFKFVLYNATPIAVDPKRPWQIVSDIGVLLGSFSSEERGRIAIDALYAAKAAGELPCNLNEWDQRHLLEEEP